ncbi:MAG: cation:proton antiporter, partial [Nitrosarchaeum sp.]|nr:cation:proton antiporter [Nitrosarchaeum sp.]
MDNSILQIDPSGIYAILSQITTGFVDQTTHIPHTSFVTDLAFIMIIGAIVTLAFFKIKQPLIIGYLFAGMLLGPLSPLWSWILPSSGPSDMLEGVGILTDISALNLFSEIGVILLLFVIGIEFPYAKIKSIGRIAIGIGTIGLFTTLGAIFYAASSLGLNSMDSLFIAAALSISSTAVIVKILEEMGRIKRESTILVLGILIVEDVIAVILISSLQSIALVGTVSVESILIVVIVATGLIVGTFTIGTKIITPLIDRVAASERHEILLLSVLGV